MRTVSPNGSFHKSARIAISMKLIFNPLLSGDWLGELEDFS